jgi:hypothetical protein
MNILKLFGFGVLIWDVVFITEAVFQTLTILPSLITQTTFIIITIITFLLSENLRILSEKKIFKYGVCWAITMILLDAVVAACCLGWSSFYQYGRWINYAIVVFMPIFTVRANREEVEQVKEEKKDK